MNYNYFRENAIKALISLADYPEDAPAARELAEQIVDNIERYTASLSHHPENLLP